MMRFDTYGEGPVLVLLPGLGCDSRMWGPLLDHLPTPYTVVCPHIWEAPTMAGAAKSVAGILDELGAAKAFVAGLSMGGYVAFELMRSHPGRVRAAALIDTTAKGDDTAKLEKRQQTLRLIAAGKYDEVLTLFIDSVTWPDGPMAEIVNELMVKMGAIVGAEGFARSMAAVRDRGDFMEVVEHSAIPMLFIAGEHDEMTPPDLAAELAAAALDGSFVAIPGAGHMSAIEAPKAVAGALGEFFRRFMALA